MGAAAVAEHLAQVLGAPALLSRFSRLLIDPNRGLDDPTLIMQISDGLIVPGNVGLDDGEIEARIARYYEPYHRADRRGGRGGVRRRQAAGARLGAQLHPSLEGRAAALGGRACCGTRTRDLRSPCSKRLRAIPGIEVGDNVPYSGQLKGDTLYRHGTTRGLARMLWSRSARI